MSEWEMCVVRDRGKYLISICILFFFFQYIDEDDIERVRQRILQRRTIQLVSNVYTGQVNVPREMTNSSVKCESNDDCPPLVVMEKTKNKNAAESHGLDAEEEKTSVERTTKCQENSINNNEINLNPSDKIADRSNHAKTAKIVAKTSAKLMDSNDNLLIRLTSIQQSIDARLDDVM